jgi:hypothetical protein
MQRLSGSCDFVLLSMLPPHQPGRLCIVQAVYEATVYTLLRKPSTSSSEQTLHVCDQAFIDSPLAALVLSSLSIFAASPTCCNASRVSLCLLILSSHSAISSSCSCIVRSISGSSLICSFARCNLCFSSSVAAGISLMVSGPLPDVSWDGEAAGGDPEVEAVAVEGSLSRDNTALRTGRMSMESGDSPSGRLKRDGGAGALCSGEFAIVCGGIGARDMLRCLSGVKEGRGP